MNELIVNRTPEQIAKEINDIKNQTKKVIIYNSIEIGRKLTEAKSLVDHGAWGNWLEEGVDYSKSTANNLMNIFKEYGNDQMSLLEENTIKSPIYAKLSYSQAIELIKIPEEEREAFIEENNVEDLSTRELKKAIEDLNKSEKAKEKAIKDLAKEKDKVKDIAKEFENSNKVNEALQNEIKKIKAELEEPQDNTEVEKLKETIGDYENKIKELEEKSKEVPSSETNEEDKAEREALKEELEKIKVEKESLEENLQSEKEKIKTELEAKLKHQQQLLNEEQKDIKFKFHFESANDAFENLLNDIDEYTEEDQENKKEKIRKLLNIMLENI